MRQRQETSNRPRIRRSRDCIIWPSFFPKASASPWESFSGKDVTGSHSSRSDSLDTPHDVAHLVFSNECWQSCRSRRVIRVLPFVGARLDLTALCDRDALVVLVICFSRRSICRDVTAFHIGLHMGQLWSVQAYSERAGATKGQVEVEDAMIAIQARAAFSFMQPPAQHVPTLAHPHLPLWHSSHDFYRVPVLSIAD